MQKTARKPSTDPAQEKLRQAKANWNKEVSEFISDLINSKKLLNGWPNKFYKERGRINNPIPADPATIIGALANDFQEIASKGNSIIQEQLNYVKTRKQKQTKKMDLPSGKTENKSDLSKQLSLNLGASRDYILIKEASNPLSRFFYRLLNPGIGFSSEKARMRRYRISLLESSLRIHKDLEIMQKDIVGYGPQSIFLAAQTLSKIEDNFVFVSSGLQSFKDSFPQGVVDAGGKIDVPSEKIVPAESNKNDLPRPGVMNNPILQPGEAALQDIMSNIDNFKGAAGLTNLKSLAKKFAMGSEKEKLALLDQFLMTYNQSINQICFNKGIPSQFSFAAILDEDLKKSEKEKKDPLQVVAQNFLGKIRHQISPFDKTSAFRLDIYKMAANCRKITNSMLDSLQSNLDVDELQPLLDELADYLMRMKTLTQSITATLKGIGHQPQFMNMLDRGGLGDHDVNLNPKQKTQLQKMLEQKQMRELTQMYSRK